MTREPYAPEPMAFGRALVFVRLGQVAWRQAWNVTWEVRLVAGRIILDRGGTCSEYAPTQEDMLADDWGAGAPPDVASAAPPQSAERIAAVLS